MKKYIFLSLAISSLFLSCSKDNQTDPFNEFVVSMETDHGSDVYYNFTQGVVKSISRNTWDLAFSTPVQTAVIRINEGADAELYCVADTAAWSTYTSFNAVEYEELLNSKSDWSLGAFNVNHDPGNIFNYGWGTYAMADHNVHGDSLYVIRLTDGSFKKMVIKKKIGATDVYMLRWANIDGSEQVDTSFSCAPYASTKHFIHYSLTGSEVVEVEPDMSEWDLLFTRYNTMIPTGPSTFMKYPVTGVLSNPDISSAKAMGVPPVSATLADAAGGFINEADVIGYDWKVSDPVTHEISLVDSLSYFVQSVDGNTYQLYFSEYGGMGQGTITIKTRLVE